MSVIQYIAMSIISKVPGSQPNPCITSCINGSNMEKVVILSNPFSNILGWRDNNEAYHNASGRL